MVGFDFFWTLYQNSGPALQVVLILGGAYVWRWHLKPRLDGVEQTQEERADRWADQALGSQERTMLLDDAHTRADDLEEAVDRLQARVRGIEQAYAVDHGKAPNGGDDDFLRGATSDDGGDT